MFPSCRNEPIYLLSKSIGWFPYDGDIGRYRVNIMFTSLEWSNCCHKLKISLTNGHVFNRSIRSDLADFISISPIWNFCLFLFTVIKKTVKKKRIQMTLSNKMMQRQQNLKKMSKPLKKLCATEREEKEVKNKSKDL